MPELILDLRLYFYRIFQVLLSFICRISFFIFYLYNCARRNLLSCGQLLQNSSVFHFAPAEMSFSEQCVTFLCRAKLIFMIIILFVRKSGRAILHHKSKSFNYETDNDDKWCVIPVQYQCHRKEGICSHSAICVSAQDKTHWWWLITIWFDIYRTGALWSTSDFWKFTMWSGYSLFLPDTCVDNNGDNNVMTKLVPIMTR